MRVGRKTTESFKTEGRNLNLISGKGEGTWVFKPLTILNLASSLTCNFTQYVMLFNTACPRGISKTPSGVIDSWPAGINKDSSCVWQHGPPGPWQFRTRPVWSIKNTPWMSAPGMVISLGKQPVGTGRIQEAKNIFVRGDYRYKVRCEQWEGFEMLN